MPVLPESLADDTSNTLFHHSWSWRAPTPHRHKSTATMWTFNQKCCPRNVKVINAILNAYFVLSGSHAVIDLLQLAVVWAQEFEGLWYRGHGSSRRANQPSKLFQRRMVQSCVLFLQVNEETLMYFIFLHKGEDKETQILTLSLSTIISKSSCNCLSSSD